MPLFNSIRFGSCGWNGGRGGMGIYSHGLATGVAVAGFACEGDLAGALAAGAACAMTFEIANSDSSATARKRSFIAAALPSVVLRRQPSWCFR